MRKLLTIFAVFVTLAFGSCVKKIENTPPSPVAAGIDIFNFTRLTTMASLDPVNVAIRLHLLLEAAVAAGDTDYADLGGLKVVTPGKPDVNIKSYLFDRAVITPDETKKIWTIVYTGALASNDNTRLGTVTIDTKGKRLSQDVVWDVSTSENFKLMGYTDMYTNHFDLYQEFGPVAVFSGENGEIDFSVSAYKGRIGQDGTPVDWSTIGEVTFGEFDTFAELIQDENAQYSLAIVTGSGKPYKFFSQCMFDTDPEYPLTYTPGCGWNSLYSGKVTASFDDYYNYIDTYPAEEVKCEYVSPTVKCGSLRLKVDYNNNSETFNLY